MKDYWLGKLICETDKVDSRKRLQKAIYLLQSLDGCPLKFHYFLHYYGPYSWDLAGLVDQLDSAGIIQETLRPAGMYESYESSITQHGRDVIVRFEEDADGREAKRSFERFTRKFKELNGRSLWVLELAATVMYFYKHKTDWQEAEEKTAGFKKVKKGDEHLLEAVELAKDYSSGGV